MKLLGRILDGISRWIDGVPAAIVAARGWFVRSRSVELIEEPADTFTLRGTDQDAAARRDTDHVRIVDGKVVGALPAALATRLKSSRATLTLQPSRFMFRPLELPRRATEFLDGIVRAQIDRLTPWSAAEAAFGFSRPTDIANDRIAVTIAATAKSRIAPLVDAVARLGADSIVISTILPDPQDGGGAPIEVFEHKVRGALAAHRVRRALLAILVVAGLAAGAAITASVVVGGDLEARQADLSRRIAARRVSLRATLDAGGNAALAALERRKHTAPSSVIVLEALSRILPDHTYVTELRIVGDVMQVVGVTRDAPSLIRLIEQSSHFTRATFFAPTTRSPNEPGEHFHIEARIEPDYSARS